MSLRFFALAWLLSVVAACSTTSTPAAATDSGPYDAPVAACANDSRAQKYVPGMKQQGDKGKFSVVLVAADPAPPARDDNKWTIDLLDASGAPVSGATFVVKPYMPDHRHGSSITPQIDPGKTGGEYAVSRLNLSMPGLWQITLTPTTSDGTTDAIVFSFCIPE